MDFSQKLQLLRTEQRLTQEELAEKLFVSRTAVSKWESGRGYPNLDSLKQISNFFNVSIDELLCADELVCLAEKDVKAKSVRFENLAFGGLDCFAGALFFLPVFGLQVEDYFLSVPLYALTDMSRIILALYVLLLAAIFLLGIAQLAFQNLHHALWLKLRKTASLTLSVGLTFLFIASGEPYAAAFTLFLLLIKGYLLIKQR